MPRPASDHPLIVVKYGGNAMRDPDLQRAVCQQLHAWQSEGARLVVVHGGGPFIQRVLDDARIPSEFVDGHRRTTPEALRYVEMALRGEVNGRLVRLLNQQGARAVGLSGKDGQTVVARKRRPPAGEDGRPRHRDLGRVGDVAAVRPDLIRLLLDHGFLPVMTCIATDDQGRDFNINADMFAGHLAGALNADHFLVLTDVDGLMRQVDDPGSLIPRLALDELDALFGPVIKGGMIPKVEACRTALRQGARSAAIVNGTRPGRLGETLRSPGRYGTLINS